MNKRLLLFTTVFAAAIVIDLLKFLATGKPTVVNWESFVHPAWVVGATFALLLASFFSLVHRVAFWLYLTVFVVAYLDVYLEFSATITYFCMIFNLLLTAIFFFSSPGTSKTDGDHDKIDVQ